MNSERIKDAAGVGLAHARDIETHLAMQGEVAATCELAGE
jgi:hypothetical protein